MPRAATELWRVIARRLGAAFGVGELCGGCSRAEAVPGRHLCDLCGEVVRAYTAESMPTPAGQSPAIYWRAVT